MIIFLLTLLGVFPSALGVIDNPLSRSNDGKNGPISVNKKLSYFFVGVSVIALSAWLVFYLLNRSEENDTTKKNPVRNKKTKANNSAAEDYSSNKVQKKYSSEDVELKNPENKKSLDGKVKNFKVKNAKGKNKEQFLNKSRLRKSLFGKKSHRGSWR